MTTPNPFVAAATKLLSPVEVDPGTSNQHEFAAGALHPLLLRHGVVSGEEHSRRLRTTVVLLEDDGDAVPVGDVLTLYDARHRNPRRGPEWRLYFGIGSPAELLVREVSAGDTLAFLLDRSGGLHVLLARSGSRWEGLLRHSLAVAPTSERLFALDGDELESAQGRSPIALIADLLGVRTEAVGDREWLLKRFGGVLPTAFPSTDEMAELAWDRSGLDVCETSADDSLTGWLETETRLFNILEEHDGTARVERCSTFEEHVEVVMSVLQRRRARRGRSLENHLERVFRGRGIRYATQVETEPGSRSDFIFPSAAAYADPGWPLARLTHLGAKSTARERWKQVLSEAARLDQRHLATLDPRLTDASLDAMGESGVRVVMPAPLAATYDRGDIVVVEEILGLLEAQQAGSRG